LGCQLTTLQASRKLMTPPISMFKKIASGVIGLLLVSCSSDSAKLWSGYVVGDYIYVSSSLSGHVQRVAVKAGDEVKAGDFLFDLDADLEKFSSAEAKARLQGAKSTSQDLSKGKRRQEIEIIQAQIAQAQAQYELAQQNLQRQQKLLDQGFVTKAAVDDAQLVQQQARARVAELTTTLQVARMPARDDERIASQASTNAAEDVVRENDWKKDQKHLTAKVAATVSEIYFHEGEFVQAGQPVLSLLPPQNLKVRFFIAQSELPLLRVGQSVKVHCDGCSQIFDAKISRIATQAEYTPPVIYSNTQRSKMVFMVEAIPAIEQGQLLHVGQPIDVSVAERKP
jgi:HlyD family secretion protein